MLLAGLLPWRDDGLSDPDPLLDVARRAPGVLGCYVATVIATLAAAGPAIASRLRIRESAGARPGSPAVLTPAVLLLPAAIAVIAALCAVLAIPLPTGRVYGAGADGRTFEFDVLSVRSWGSYVSLAGAAMCFSAVALLRRRDQ